MHAELIPDDVHEPSDPLQPENDMSLVRGIPIVVREG